MTKNEELDLFLLRVDEFIESKYILADIKIVNLLKSIAQSDTLLAIFKNCLTGFDFNEASNKYLVKSKYSSADKGEFVLPTSSKELLAFIFNILVKIDSKKIDFSAFIKKYFYEDGSFSTGYSAFLNNMIKPFRSSVKTLMESVIEGKVQDPVEALTEEEARREAQKKDNELREKKEKEISKLKCGKSIVEIKKMLLEDKTNIKSSKFGEEEIKNATLIVDMFANSVESRDKDAIEYAFISYKYMAKSHRFFFRKKVKKIEGLLKDILNGI